jgi:hypothetical protein
MGSRRWRSIQSGIPESAHGSPELVKHALLVEVDGMSCNTPNGPSQSRIPVMSLVSIDDALGALVLQGRALKRDHVTRDW